MCFSSKVPRTGDTSWYSYGMKVLRILERKANKSILEIMFFNFKELMKYGGGERMKQKLKEK